MMAATLGEYIKGDLKHRLGSGLRAPEALTLAALSDHYGVSPTPVREAVRDLVAEGVLLKGPGGRISVNPDGIGAEARGGALDRPRGLDHLEAALASEAIGRGLRGEGGYLREEATARRVGVGRTAVRQVFGRLVGRGLLVHDPRRGWRVRLLDQNDLAAYLEVREALELKALDLARPWLVEADLRRMLAGNEGDRQSPRLENDLHRYLIEKAGNPYIRDFFDHRGAYYATLLDFAAPETEVVAEMARQHRAILVALIDRDWPLARRELSRHIRAQGPIVRELLTRIDPNRSPERRHDRDA